MNPCRRLPVAALWVDCSKRPRTTVAHGRRLEAAGTGSWRGFSPCTARGGEPTQHGESACHKALGMKSPRHEHRPLSVRLSPVDVSAHSDICPMGLWLHGFGDHGHLEPVQRGFDGVVARRMCVAQALAGAAMVARDLVRLGIATGLVDDLECPFSSRVSHLDHGQSNLGPSAIPGLAGGH